MTPNDVLSILNDPVINIILAGAAGGTVKWLRLKEPIGTGLATVIVGGITAHYFSPIALAIIKSTLGAVLEMTPTEASRLGGFLVGSMATTLVGATVDLVTRYFDKTKDKQNEQQG